MSASWRGHRPSAPAGVEEWISRAEANSPEIQALKSQFEAAQLEVEKARAGHYPTLPSSEIPISFCASTANSIGSSWMTSLTKPLTISAIASSSGMPRCMT